MEEKQQILSKKVKFINSIYKLAISETSTDLLNIADLKLGNLISETNYNSFVIAYKQLYYKIKFLDKQVKRFHCFIEDYEMLRFKLLTVYKSIYNVLHRDYDISQICVNDETDEWIFIS